MYEYKYTVVPERIRTKDLNDPGDAWMEAADFVYDDYNAFDHTEYHGDDRYHPQTASSMAFIHGYEQETCDMIRRGELFYDYFGKMAADNTEMESDDDDNDDDSDSDDDSFAEWFRNNQDKIPGVGTGDDRSYITKDRFFMYEVQPDGHTLYGENG